MSDAFHLSIGEILLLDLPTGDGAHSACAIVRLLSPDERKALKTLPDKGLEGEWLQWPSALVLLHRPGRPDAWADLWLWGPEGGRGCFAAETMRPVWRLRFGPRSAFALLPPGGRVEIRSLQFGPPTSPSRFVAVQAALDGDESVVTVDVGQRTRTIRSADRAVRLLEARLSAAGAEGVFRAAPAPEEAGWTPDFLVAICGDEGLFLAAIGKGKDGRVGAEQALERILGR